MFLFHILFVTLCPVIALNGTRAKLNLAVNVVICIRVRTVLIHTCIVQSLTYECSIVAHRQF